MDPYVGDLENCDCTQLSLDRCIFSLLDNENRKYLSRKEILDILKEKGISITENKLWSEVNYHGEEFHIIPAGKTHLIGLRKWAPFFIKHKRTAIPHNKFLSFLKKRISIQDSIERTVNSDHIFLHEVTEDEIRNGYLSINPSFLLLFKAISAGDDVIPISIKFSAEYSFDGWLHRYYHSIYSQNFQEFFRNNNLKSGDMINYSKDVTSPAGILLFFKPMVNIDKSIRSLKGIEIKSSKSQQLLSIQFLDEVKNSKANKIHDSQNITKMYREVITVVIILFILLFLVLFKIYY